MGVSTITIEIVDGVDICRSDVDFDIVVPDV